MLSIGLRGSTGFGKAFVNAADREWGGRMQDDLIDGIQWADAKGYADLLRLGFHRRKHGWLCALMPDQRRRTCLPALSIFSASRNLLTFMQTIPAYWKPDLALDIRRLADPGTEEGRASAEGTLAADATSIASFALC